MDFSYCNEIICKIPQTQSCSTQTLGQQYAIEAFLYTIENNNGVAQNTSNAHIICPNLSKPTKVPFDEHSSHIRC